MARFIRENIEEHIPEEYGDFLDLVAQIRNDLRSKKLKPNFETWQKAIKEEIGRDDLGQDWMSTRQRLKNRLEK
jgi:siroheme synthase (precorrin-2 oxidase/ferrochelatase)